MAPKRRLTVRSARREQLIDITNAVAGAVAEAGLQQGVIQLWTLHTTCALTVNEGADPDVAADLLEVMRRLIPRSAHYKHEEGNTDAHVKTSLFGPGLTLLVEDGRLVLGTWQHVFLAEWDGPRERTLAYTIIAAAP